MIWLKTLSEIHFSLNSHFNSLAFIIYQDTLKRARLPLYSSRNIDEKEQRGDQTPEEDHDNWIDTNTLYHPQNLMITLPKKGFTIFRFTGKWIFTL